MCWYHALLAPFRAPQPKTPSLAPAFSKSNSPLREWMREDKFRTVFLKAENRGEDYFGFIERSLNK